MANVRATITVWSGDSLDYDGKSPDILAQASLSEYQLKKALRMFVAYGAKRRSRLYHPHRQEDRFPCFVAVEWVLPHAWISWHINDYPCKEVNRE